MDKTWVVWGHHNEAKDDAAKRMRQGMTSTEKRLWHHLRGNQLDGIHFCRQQAIDGYIADFYCHAACLVIEVDGGVPEARGLEDRERDPAIGTRGLRVIRFTNARVLRDLSAVLDEIRNAVRLIEA